MGFLIAAIIIAAILCLRVSVRIGVDENFSLIAGVGFIKLRIFPAKEKKLKLSDYRIDKYRKREEKKRLAAEKKKAKKAKKSAPAEQKAASQPAGKSVEKEKRDIPALLSKLTRVAGVFLKRFGKHLRIDLRKLNIIIATGDAAQTAIIYGAVIGAVQNLYALLVNSGTLRTTRKSELFVEPDFLSEKMRVEVDLRFSFMIWQLFDMAIRAGVEFLKNEED